MGPIPVLYRAETMPPSRAGINLGLIPRRRRASSAASEKKMRLFAGGLLLGGPVARPKSEKDRQQTPGNREPDNKNAVLSKNFHLGC